ncbi:MAG: deoxyribonuclease IV [Dethiobacter sp.]|jgi:deoxyribonuclease-4|nr:deoxyribonuclease IV [Dethiobacter sp.]
MRLGSHLSISKGFDNAAELAREIGANTFQFFTRNPRGGSARSIEAAEIEKWRLISKEYDIKPVVGHLPYTVNLAAPAERAYNFAKMILADELIRMDRVGVEYLVIHPGSHAGSGKEEGLRRIIACLEETFMPFAGKTVLLLETMAGQGSEIGTPDDISMIISALGNPEGIGVCIDSCHLTGDGYDFLQKDDVEKLACDLDGTVGLNRVKALHLNDSKFPPGSHKDRHERIGRGYLGKDGLLNLITHPVFVNLPMLLETPVDDYRQYGEEITLIRSWLEESVL